LDELEELRKRRLQSLQSDLQQRLQESQQREQEELQRQSLLQRLLEPKSRERLARLRLANPELAEKAENVILYLYQSGQLKGKVTDDQLKLLLEKLAGKRETKIRRV
jgi:programmed cell death protein 5